MPTRLFAQRIHSFIAFHACSGASSRQASTLVTRSTTCLYGRQPSASSSPPGRRSKRLLSRPAIDYAGQADEASNEEMPAKRRRPLSTVQGDTESRSRDGTPSSSKGFVKSTKKGKGLAGSAKKSKVLAKSPKGAKQTTGRHAAPAATEVEENVQPQQNELPPNAVRLSLLSHLPGTEPLC